MESDDYEQVITHNATKVSLKVSAILELEHTNSSGSPSKYIPYSLEAALLSSSMIKFQTVGEALTHSSFVIFCECCEKYIYKEEKSAFTMAEAMRSLPDAMFCHKLLPVLGKKSITQYLFDKDFDFSCIQSCVDGMSDQHTQNDCCIGNDQQFLDALTVGSNKNELIACTIDLMDAFFLVPLEKKKQHPSVEDVFLPLEEMMRLKLHDSLTPTLQT